MIVGVRCLFVIRIIVYQSCQTLLAKIQIIQFILENNARIVKSVFDDSVTGFYLFVCKRYLCQIILTFVWIVDSTVNGIVLDGIIIRVCHCRTVRVVGAVVCPVNFNHSLVYSLPVVYIISLSPLLLERSLALDDGRLVVEVP